MKPPRKGPPSDPDLREVAQAQLASAPRAAGGLRSADELLHELQVHQIELEMQNETLRQAQLDLTDSRDRYVELYEFAPVGYLTLTVDGMISQLNLTAATLLGKERRSLLQRAFTSCVVVDDQARWAQLFMGVKQDEEGRGSAELTLKRADGEVFQAQVDCVGAARGASGVRITLTDVSERERAKRERLELEARVQQARKMESVGLLAGGIAHDFNNMLAVVLGNVQLALEHLAASEPILDELTEIQKAATRSADLTQQLLAFARKQTISPRVLDLNEAVPRALKMLGRLIGEDIQLRWSPQPGLSSVMLDPSQLDQILVNLCINARDAIAGVGEIVIETRDWTVRTGGEDARTLAPGDYVRLTVRDDGHGMDQATQARIFEPFFTTKGVGEGTGLGLATVYGIVHQNRGAIDVHSTPGLGTTFTIHFPRQLPLLVDGSPTNAAPSRLPVRGHETILLVEDEPALLKVFTRMLTKLGYEVLAANAPAEALRLADAHPAIHLLVTDVIMPGMNGRELARSLQSRHPHLKLLFMSGYAADVIPGALDAAVHFIQKPFAAKGLAAKVREALDRA